MSEKYKNCSNDDCKERNPQLVENFYKRRDAACGLYSRCKSCCKKSDVKRKEAILAKQRAYNVGNRQKIKNINLVKNYGITIDEYKKMLAAQNHKCAICEVDEVYSGKKGLFVDHDHESSEVRGLLCSKCNFLIGHAQEDVLILHKAIKYLKYFKKDNNIVVLKDVRSAR